MTVFFVFTFLLVINRSVLFKSNLIEEGDDAANAFQINLAKEGKLIYGNYSRFGFYHPGPAFFYVQAAGEKILYDWLHLVPQPYNAKAISNLLLQLIFLITGLFIFLKHTSIAKPVVIGLIFLCASMFYSKILQSLQSIWPPHVLIMPFFCFIMASSSVASGRMWSLPIMVLVGSFLVHGHIAQPLFVIPIALLSYWKLIINSKLSHYSNSTPMTTIIDAHLVSFLILAIFVLPFLKDIFGPGINNFQLIQNHLQQTRLINNNPSLVLASFGTMLFYDFEPERTIKSGSDFWLHFTTERGLVLSFWILCICFIVFALYKLHRQQKTSNFFVNFFTLTFIALCLTFIWGLRQEYRLLGFNNLFAYSILFCIILLTLESLSSHFIRFNFLLINGIILLFSVLVISQAYIFYTPSPENYEQQIYSNVSIIVNRNESRSQTVILKFPKGAWAEAITTALLLERKNFDVYATLIDKSSFHHPSLRLIFRPHRFIDNQNIHWPKLPYTVWTFIKDEQTNSQSLTNKWNILIE